MDVMKLLNDYPFTTLNDLDKFFFSCDTSNASDCFAYALKFLEKYPYVTMQDVEKHIIRGSTLSVIDTKICTINSNREKEKLFGREHFEAGPLLHVHSVHVKPEDAIKDKPLSVYGTIRVKYEHIKSGKPMQLDVYNRSSDDADYISPRGGDLALGWPNTFPNCNDMWVGLQGTGIEVDLYLKIGDEGFGVDDIFITVDSGLHDGRSEFHKHKATNDMEKVEMEAAELEQPKAKLLHEDCKMNGVI
ncbi:unnamed protein product [Cuscuta campestris]|uniref:Uncharacterized protein n=1 Tax=Cuscuta campestris TaxID=132261 RepID=A0A484L1W9_9ASTE|nr:unnamed protein product [Cuscuta campestris]